MQPCYSFTLRYAVALVYSWNNTKFHKVIILGNKVAPWVMKESIHCQNIDTQSGNSTNASGLLTTYGVDSSESSLFYHYTLDCFGCVLFHLSKYLMASLLLREVHVSSKGIQASSTFSPSAQSHCSLLSQRMCSRLCFWLVSWETSCCCCWWTVSQQVNFLRAVPMKYLKFELMV